MTLTEMLLLVIAVTLLVVSAQVIRLAARVSKAADALDELQPGVSRLVREAEEALADVRKTSGRIDRLTETIEHGTVVARQLVVPFLTRVGALVIGAKAGLEVLRRVAFHRGNGTVVARGEGK